MFETFPEVVRCLSFIEKQVFSSYIYSCIFTEITYSATYICSDDSDSSLLIVKYNDKYKKLISKSI